MKRNILVTGANRGIGKEIVKHLATKGHKVVATARDLENLKASIATFQGDVIPLTLDVSDPASVALLHKQLSEQIDHLDVLINNAGVFSSTTGPMVTDMKEVAAVLSTNLLGPWRLSQSLLPLLQRSDDARIVNMSSSMGAWDEMSSDYAAYRMSKIALNALTRMMADELSGQVTVNTMCPGWVRTDMGGPNASRSVEEGADTAVWLATAEEIPSGKFLHDRKVIDW